MDWVRGALFFAAIVPSVVVHEVSHGLAAFLLGDTTAKDRGRLSLNPLKHVDPFGTLLLPLLMIATVGFGFGYAKPVPVNPHRFRDYRMGFFLSSLAGPASNLALASVGAIGVRLLGLVAGESGVLVLVQSFFYIFVLANLVLMFFNIIPIPPLDGSRVIPLILSDRGMESYRRFERYGMLVLFALLLVGPWLGFDVIGSYLRVTVYPVLEMLTGVR